MIDKNDPKGISFHMEIENKNLKMNLNLEFKKGKSFKSLLILKNIFKV